MSIKNLCVRESYQDKSGNEKVSWNKVGIMIDKGEKKYIKLYHMPGVMISVFDQKKKEESIDVDNEPGGPF